MFLEAPDLPEARVASALLVRLLPHQGFSGHPLLRGTPPPDVLTFWLVPRSTVRTKHQFTSRETPAALTDSPTLAQVLVTAHPPLLPSELWPPAQSAPGSLPSRKPLGLRHSRMWLPNQSSTSFAWAAGRDYRPLFWCLTCRHAARMASKWNRDSKPTVEPRSTLAGGTTMQNH